MKICKKCLISKPLSDFGENRRMKDGLKSKCKQCISEDNKRRYQKNREEVLDRVKNWQEQNHDKLKKYKRDYARRKRSKESEE